MTDAEDFLEGLENFVRYEEENPSIQEFKGGDYSRDELQEKVVDLYMQSAMRNTLILGTGFGKSFVAIMILERMLDEGILDYDSKILLLVNSTDLRDNNWKAEFIKKGREDIYNILDLDCYQAAYQFKDKEYDLLIADEIDFSLTDMYKLVYQNCKFDRILGLTGYVAKTKQEDLILTAPAIVRVTTQDAQDRGILNKTQLVYVNCKLGFEKTITVEYTKNGQAQSFTQSENSAYIYAEKKIKEAKKEIDYLEAELALIPTARKNISKRGALTRKIRYQEKILISSYSKRKEILHNSIGTAEAAKTLREMVFGSKPDSKVVTFSMSQNQAKRITPHTHFGGYQKKGTVSNLELLQKGEIDALGVCKAIDRGTNVEGLNCIILEGYDSSTTRLNQIHGRGMRLHPDETMYLYVLIPHYTVKEGNKWVSYPTKANDWQKRMLEDFNFKNPLTISI